MMCLLGNLGIALNFLVDLLGFSGVWMDDFLGHPIANVRLHLVFALYEHIRNKVRNVSQEHSIRFALALAAIEYAKCCASHVPLL
jgi:hypothetical protein